MRRRVTWIAAAVGVLVAVAGTVLITEYTDAILAQSLSGVAAVIAVVGAAVTIVQGRAAARQTLSHDYASRGADRGWIKDHTLISAFLRLEEPPEAFDREKWNAKTKYERKQAVDDWTAKPRPERRERKLEQWRDLPREDKGQILLYLNFLEELAAMYELGRLDRDIIRSQFGDAARTYYQYGRWFIDTQRAGDPKVYDKWEELNRELAGGIHLPSREAEQVGFVAGLPKLLKAIKAGIPTDSLLFLEGVATDLRASVKVMQVDGRERRRLFKGDPTDWGDPGDFHVPVNTVDEVLKLVAPHADPPIHHVLAYRGKRVLLQAYNAGEGLVYLNRKRLCDEQLETLRTKLT